MTPGSAFDRTAVVVEAVQFSMYIFILIYKVMKFLKNGHGKSWESHGISFPDLCGKPVLASEVSVAQKY